MKTIHKFPFKVDDRVTIEMPDGALVLCAQSQRNVPCIFAMVDTDRPKTKRHFSFYGTGHEDRGADRRDYVGTVQTNDGYLVWHIFEDSK